MWCYVGYNGRLVVLIEVIIEKSAIWILLSQEGFGDNYVKFRYVINKLVSN